jgi:membrane-bound serine protease (ClpP class)
VAGRNLRGLLVAALIGGALAASAHAQNDAKRVLAVYLDNDINPVTQEYVENAVDRAEDDGMAAVVLVLDTPGGLASSMRGIVKRFLAADVPVVVYVAPPGSSADSAGAVIAMAADVAAMAPQTNIGSSTPISLGGEDISEDLRRKIVNDAAAYVGELAREHGRNVRAARKMVTEAANYGARQAEAIGLVEVVSPTLPALLREIDGMKTVPKGYVLDTAGAEIVEEEMSFWQKARDFLVDPNLIALMLSIGLIGIVVELWNPGLVFPGTVGAISLILGLYGLQVLPVSLAGVLLMLLAAGFFVAEAFVMSRSCSARSCSSIPQARRIRCRCRSRSG